MFDRESMRERLAHDVSAKGLGRVCDELGMFPATLKGFLDGSTAVRGKTMAKIGRYFDRRLLEDLRSAVGYDAATARSAVGVSLAASLMGMERSRLAAYLRGGADIETAADRDAIVRYIEEWPEPECDETGSQTPRWALGRDEMSDFMLDELDALHASGGGEDLFLVPGGPDAVSACVSGEWVPYGASRAVHLALGCASPAEQACPTFGDYIAWLSSHSLPPVPDGAALSWECLEYGDAARIRILMLLEETCSLTYDGIDWLAADMGLPKVNKACPGLNDTIHLASYLEDGGYVSQHLADRIADYLARVA